MSSVCRPDGHQNNLRSAAYEALMEIVKNSAKDCYPAVQKTTLVIMERLQQVLQMEVRWRGRGGRDLDAYINHYINTVVLVWSMMKKHAPR